jgi:hypothetical protein
MTAGATFEVGSVVEVCEPFLPGESGGAKARFAAAGFALLVFDHQEFGEEPAVGQVVAGGAGGLFFVVTVPGLPEARVHQS